jgi:hypothetical protein
MQIFPACFSRARVGGRAATAVVATATCLVLAACAGDGAVHDSTDSETAVADTVGNVTAATPDVSLVDTSIAPAIAGRDGWNYRQEASADVTGDGVAERIVLTAHVEMLRGQPVWDDGQAWQVYVEHADTTRTYLYANRLQLGTLSMRLARPGSGQAATIVLIEHLPDRLRVAEAAFTGGRLVTRLLLERALDPVGDIASPMR